MTTARPHLTPTRARLGGLSVLLVVALVFQASADLRAETGLRGAEAIARAAVQTPSRAATRVPRRQSERPEFVREAARREAAARGLTGAARPATAPSPRGPSPLEGDLPPPAC